MSFSDSFCHTQWLLEYIPTYVAQYGKEKLGYKGSSILTFMRNKCLMSFPLVPLVCLSFHLVPQCGSECTLWGGGSPTLPPLLNQYSQPSAFLDSWNRTDLIILKIIQSSERRYSMTLKMFRGDLQDKKLQSYEHLRSVVDFCDFDIFKLQLRKGFKNLSQGKFPWGGVSPFSANFFH